MPNWTKKRAGCWTLCVLLLSGCAGHMDRVSDEISSVETLRTQASVALKKRDYPIVIKHCESIMAHYPFGIEARLAHIRLVYAQYRNQEWDKAVQAADKFVQLYPGDPHAAYVYYIRARAQESSARSFLKNLLHLDPSVRDPAHLKEAFFSYKQLVTAHPDSPYAPLAVQRMRVVRNVLAAYEWQVAKFYLDRGAEVAAFNRARNIVATFSETPVRDQALGMMAQLYRLWEQPEYAQEVDVIRKMNGTRHPE